MPPPPPEPDADADESDDDPNGPEEDDEDEDEDEYVDCSDAPPALCLSVKFTLKIASATPPGDDTMK